MRPSRCLQVAAAMAAVALLAPPAIRAQEFVRWTACEPLSTACASVQLSTAAVFDGADRVGTNVTIALHNLNGQIADDHTPWSGLIGAMFISSGRFSGATLEYFPALPLNLTGGATGSDTWDGLVWSMGGGVGPERGLVGASINQAVAVNALGGCTSSPLSFYATPALTCGSAATASVSFRSNRSFDALDFDGISLNFTAPGYHNVACYTNVYGYDEDRPCDALGFTATPEPATVSLLVAGLLGVAGVRLRRKRKAAG